MSALQLGIDPNLYTEDNTNIDLEQHKISKYTRRGFKRSQKVYVEDENRPRQDQQVMDYETNLEGGTLIPVQASKRILNKYRGDKDPSAPQ